VDASYIGLGIIGAYLLLVALATVATFKFGDAVRDVLAGLIRSELSRIRSEEAAAQRQAIDADIAASKGRS
jgi:hypothetical protein